MMYFDPEHPFFCVPFGNQEDQNNEKFSKTSLTTTAMFTAAGVVGCASSPWRDLDDALEDCDSLVVSAFERVAEFSMQSSAAWPSWVGVAQWLPGLPRMPRASVRVQ